MAVFFGLSALVCVTATVVPLRMARRRLDGVER
jgi:hypothetical protein